MPPKKQDEIDINALPPLKALTIGLLFECGKSRAAKLQQLLKDTRSFQKNVTREEIINFCKEKALYVDPATLTDKQKKDTKFMAEVSTELTSAVMAKGIDLFVQEQVLAIRKARYQAAQEKLAPPVVKKDDKKQDKKGKEVVVAAPVPEIEKPPEKEYQKNFDLLFIFVGVPHDAAEIVDGIMVVKEKVINWGGVDMALLEQAEDYQEELDQRMEDFQEAKPLKRSLSQESVEFIASQKAIAATLRKQRAETDRAHPLRNLTIKEVLLEMDLDNEDEILKQYQEQLLEEICQFSLDQVQYQQWIQNKKTQPLLTKDAPKDPFDLEVEKIQQEALKHQQEQQRIIDEQLAEKSKKGAKKEAKKTEAELEAERQAHLEQQHKEELQKQKIQAALDQQQRMKEKLHLQYYKKQLEGIDLTKTSPTILLEVLLDQMQSEDVYLKAGKIPPCLEDADDQRAVERILDKAFEEPKPAQQFRQLLIDELDEIEIRCHSTMINSQSVSEREHRIFDNLQFPGIDRHMMPEVPEKSEKLRKALKSKLHPFINVEVQEFERRQSLIAFEDLLKENEPEQEWWFGDRIYLERHNKNTLRQKFLQALLQDPQVITKYLPDEDALLVVCYNKNPPGRTLRKKWSAEWRVLPNLENFINIRNFNSDFFYDIDYQKIGNFYERSKIMYPSDNSLIVATKYQLGDEFKIRYKVIKENLVFGIQNDIFYADVPDMRITVQIEEKAILNVTMKSGLNLRFTATGDVVQQYLNYRKQDQSQSLFNLYDNAEINHEVELKRIVTGMGSVITYQKDGSINVLYKNGNVASYKNDQWTTTNNQGFRKNASKSERIPCATKTDPETGAVVYIRDDQTMMITYKDGSVYTQHFDGTTMLSIGDQVTVEHPNYASVKVTLDRVKMRTNTIIGMGSAYANVGAENIFERSNDGRLIETFFNNTKVVSYLEKQELPEYQQFRTNRINLLYMQDGTVLKVVDDGEIVIVSSDERVRLTEQYNSEHAYWLQLFSVPDERKSGIFTSQLNNGIIFTKDDESNYFCINQNGDVISKISVSLNQEPSSPDQIPDGLFVDEDNKFLPAPKSWIPPRCFLIYNDNTGVEFYNQHQLEYYFRQKTNNPYCTKIVEDLPNARSISFLTELLNNNKKFINVHIPQTLDIVPKTQLKKTIVPLKIYTYRNFLQYKVFDKEARQIHDQCLVKYDNWAKSIAKCQNEFGVLQKSEEEKDAEFMIQMRILESRKTDYSTESYDQIKAKIILPEVQEESISEEATIQKSARGAQVVQQAMLDLQKKAQEFQYSKSEKIKESEVRGFVENYFETKEGIEASKQFPQEVFVVTVKPRVKIQQPEEVVVQAEEIPINSNPIVQLEVPPESQYPEMLPKQIIIKPSVFTQAEIDEEVRLKKIEDDALKYRNAKKKSFDVYGKDRQEFKKVPCLLKTNPKFELNQKYILTDASTENRVKISSMATRVYQNAPNINEIRNEGMHQTIIRTLDKKNNLDDLIDRKNLMISNDLNDKLRKDLTINPIAVRFGDLREKGLYEVKITVKNEDILAQRIVIKQPQQKFIKVYMKQMGQISLGLVRDVFVQISALQVGQFSDEFQIVSKHAIYTIPVSGQVLESNIFDKVNIEQIKLSSRPLLKKTVRDLKEITQNQIQGDSQDSELLPKLKYDKNFKIDPYQNQKKDAQSDEEDQ